MRAFYLVERLTEDGVDETTSQFQIGVSTNYLMASTANGCSPWPLIALRLIGNGCLLSENGLLLLTGCANLPNPGRGNIGSPYPRSSLEFVFLTRRSPSPTRSYIIISIHRLLSGINHNTDNTIIVPIRNNL